MLVGRGGGSALRLSRWAWPTDADDPYMIIYTSGTTGSAEGRASTSTAASRSRRRRTWPTAFDLQPGDTLFWFTDLGWMMGPWLIAGGADARRRPCSCTRARPTTRSPTGSGAGRASPDHAPRDRPDAVRALMRLASEPVPSARPVVAAGARLDRRAVEPRSVVVVLPGGRRRSRLPIINYSGGTEIGGGIVGCTTIAPIAPCSFTGPVTRDGGRRGRCRGAARARRGGRAGRSGSHGRA